MSLPKHNNPSQEEDWALAPYNFVPLPEQVVTVDDLPDQDEYQGHSGYIECLLTTETPLYTRCMMNPDFFRRWGDKAFYDLEDDQKKERAHFFHIEEAQKPVIPGSSLRGMIRTLVEIITYSKVQPVSEDPLVYRAVGDTTRHGLNYRGRIMREDKDKHYTPLIQAGYMEKGPDGWRIRPAQTINGTIFARIRIKDIPANLTKLENCQNAQRIYIQPGPYQYQNVRGDFLKIKYTRVVRVSATPADTLIDGTLASSGKMFSKRTEAVLFPPDEDAACRLIPDKLEQLYREQISPEQKKLLGEEGVLNEGQPVFYLVEDGKLRFFGHTMMMRLPYRQAPCDLVPEHLRREADVDMAEAIFGYAKEKGKQKAYAGRVFVTDAELAPAQQPNIWLSESHIIPKILAGPKPTTFQHYLVQTEPDPQLARHTRKGDPRYVKELSDYTDPNTVIRGHKLYWHKGKISLADIQEPEKISDEDKQHTWIRPVDAGVEFKFKLHFENLTDAELGALLWALSLPGEAGQEYRHKLGMGKPLGLGTVKLEPILYLNDRQARYQSLFADEHNWWQTATFPAEIEGYIHSFEAFMLNRIDDGDSLAAVERIQMLLAMSKWPGPDRELTRYMEIERPSPRAKRGKINEYRDRPVLPDPLFVLGEQPLPAQQPGRSDIPAGYRRGVVTKFGLGKNQSFGFIQPDGGGQEIFVHRDQLHGSLNRLEMGQRVAFKVVQEKKGPSAQDVRVIK